MHEFQGDAQRNIHLYLSILNGYQGETEEGTDRSKLAEKLFLGEKNEGSGPFAEHVRISPLPLGCTSCTAATAPSLSKEPNGDPTPLAN